jgi:MazG family protein
MPGMSSTPLPPIERLREIMAILRSPEGCPWDREQNHQTIKPQLIEECYELIEAIEAEDDALMQEELGDVLLHIVFHAQLARERGAFDFDAVARGICDKLVRRHPHVFGDDALENSAQVLKRWDELKKQEKPERTSALAGVPGHLPALMRAQELQKKAAKVGFDWPAAEPVLAKVREEIDELAADFKNHEKAKEELGDLFFALVNLARHLKVDAEEACREASGKFKRRFEHVEEACRREGRAMEDCTLEELDRHWEAAKRL